ncbi:glutamate-1-semialdehyde 2,1-aminomutase [Keratinibaculum paraultunense]|uniref:Glutamate-1-semialdehyde 2,1-aminomutase n=1 Tax=Keratinibaculum paraultunense TaxID=1278232 RepID=A0A4R3KRF4_9FIRM|nr:glutamate-1-semialdehyde 2,1-aminomutase [Keratinibaculum paraultunense]QQY79547.1 glutamate-1-semialdehyde 2,1-aminomutase [Keratinibaculum paraultunense]TCS87572.1 glutamate-1-semialdehyde 2,1-aminomutase [Keratinibaculum paraultunense]
MNLGKSKKIYDEAIKYIPGGVNSPVRAFKSVGTYPIFIKKGHGSKIEDEDGNKYIDYICSWGPLILGHSNEKLLEGIDDILRSGISFGLPTKIEVDMAKLIVESYNGIEMVRMVNSGTEATMSAIRVARGYTGRDKIIKFEGCYHGHNDCLLVKSGSGTITYGIPTSSGVPADIIKNTIVCKYNDLEDVRKTFEKFGEDIAAVIIEPVAGNMGVVPSDKEFLEGLRRITKENGSLLIFDEVITGFRISYGGAGEVYGIEPDMACFGKIIGGGFPVGAYGGKREIMEMVSPIGPVYQAGTLSGNPLAMHIGYRILKVLKENKNIYKELEEKAIMMEEGIRRNIEELNINAKIVRFKSMLTLFFGKGPFKNFDDVQSCDIEMYAKYFNEMLKRGIMLPPAQFEGMFLSAAHTKKDIEYTIKANYEALKVIK